MVQFLPKSAIKGARAITISTCSIGLRVTNFTGLLTKICYFMSAYKVQFNRKHQLSKTSIVKKMHNALDI